MRQSMRLYAAKKKKKKKVLKAGGAATTGNGGGSQSAVRVSNQMNVSGKHSLSPLSLLLSLILTRHYDAHLTLTLSPYFLYLSL